MGRGNIMFKGSYTALITPFRNGEIDWRAFEKLVEWQINEGSHGLVPCGTTGESPTLSHFEHNKVIEVCVKIANGRVKVMAGTGSNSTSEAIMMTEHAQRVGADGALIMTPYYNKPTQEGLYQHFKAIHNATDIPIILYNIPGRSVVDIKDETLSRLIELPRIAGIKDATGDLKRPITFMKILENKNKKNFSMLSGEDGTALKFNELGGIGCISVTANIVPELCAEMQSAWLSGDKKKAKSIQDKLTPLHNIMFCETNPGPVKYAASLIGLCNGEMRLPMVLPSEENKAKIKKVMKDMGLI